MNPRSITALALGALAVGAAGCAGSLIGDRPGPIRGQVRNLEDPTAAVVEVYRVARRERAEHVSGAGTVPTADGGFVTGLLPRGDYIVVLRLPDRPPAYSKARVPGPRVALTSREPAGDASVEIRAAMSSRSDATFTLVQADPSGPIADRRSIPLRGGAPIIVSGLEPGRWWLDIPSHGVSLEMVLLGAQAVPDRLVVSPPPRVPGAVLTGRVTRDGSPVAGVVVAVRPIVEGYGSTRTWGRYAVTESDGGYRVADLPEGASRIRVESHDGPILLLPPAVTIEIPPSGDVSRDFAIGR